MGKYLKFFKSASQYEEYINSTEDSLPIISLIYDDNMIHYNPCNVPKVISKDVSKVATKITPKAVPNYLKFKAKKNSTISLNSMTSPDIKYSLNEGEWTQWDYSDITLKKGDTLCMKGNNSNGFSTSTSSYNKFQMTGKIGVSGNIMSLLYEDDFEGKLTIPCEFCFAYMFANCTSLTTAPELPAKTLAEGCYAGMFAGCTLLTTSPKLPAKKLAVRCYAYMFEGCTALTTASKLPATILANECYYEMFQFCSSLATAPDLPATTLTSACYNNMFYGCVKLNYIKMLATDISDSNCLTNWIDGVASTGTFVKHANMTSLSNGINGIPTGWTVEDAA